MSQSSSLLDPKIVSSFIKLLGNLGQVSLFPLLSSPGGSMHVGAVQVPFLLEDFVLFGGINHAIGPVGGRVESYPSIIHELPLALGQVFDFGHGHGCALADAVGQLGTRDSAHIFHPFLLDML